jgi:aspartate/methionine/tyrosine aminotransferase
MQVPERIRSISPPFMDALIARSKALRRDGADVISLGQGVPGFAPVEAAIDSARQSLSDPATHVYGADAGLLSLRQALSERLKKQSGMKVDPKREMLITAGANYGFLLTLLTLLEPGDKVLLPSPFYFDHETSIRIVGAVPVEVPLREDTGFQLTLADLEPHLKTRPRALVMVSPNNPTGAVYDPREMREIARALASRDVTIITDETYQHFTYEGAEHFSLGSLAEARSHVITIGSFSKTYSLTGWRVGYLISDADYLQQALKVQDSMMVCTPIVSQMAALGALGTPAEELARRREMLAERRRLLIDRLASIQALAWRPTQGAYFALVSVQGCTDSVALARDLLERVHLAVVPGSVFGQTGEGYLRLSYGSVDLDQLDEACRRLAQYFETIRA